MIATEQNIMPLPNFGEQGNDHGFVFKRVVARPISKKKPSTPKPAEVPASRVANKLSNNNVEDDGDMSSPEIARRSKVRPMSENDGPMILNNNKMSKKLSFRTPLKPKKSLLKTAANNNGNGSSVIKEMQVPLAKIEATPLIKSTKRKGTPLASRASKHSRQSILPGHPLGKNKRQSVAGKRRRSTFGIRGKRASSIGSGFSVHPHDSVDTADFYRHISPELPEPVRLRQLLTWCTRRINIQNLVPGKPVHPVVNGVIDDMQRSLESGKVYLSWYRRTIDQDAIKPTQPKEQQPHPLNVKNTEKRADLLNHIAKLKQEYAKWKNMLSKAGNAHVQSMNELPDGAKQVNLGKPLPEGFSIKLDDEIRDSSLEKLDIETKETLEKVSELKEQGDQVGLELTKETEFWVDKIGYQLHKDLQEQRKSAQLIKAVSQKLNRVYHQKALKAATTMQTRPDVGSDPQELLRAFSVAKSKTSSKSHP